MRSTTGNPEPGPARKPVETVTMPGAASAAVGASSNAATKMLLSLMACSSSASPNAREERAFLMEQPHQPKD
jgi:hypothetical protein